jgi:hypothetical protein
VKEEYVELIQMTKMALEQHFGEGQLVEAASFKPQKPAEVLTKAQPQPSAPPLRPVAPSAPKPMKPPQEEVQPPAPKPKAHEPKIVKPPSHGSSTVDDTLALLAKTVPHLKLQPLPEDWIDLYMIHDVTEIDLYQKLASSLNKRGIKTALLKASDCGELQFHSPAKLALIRKDLLLSSPALHVFAKRDQNRRLHLGRLPVLIVPSDEELQSPESKRSFWEQLMNALQ